MQNFLKQFKVINFKNSLKNVSKVFMESSCQPHLINKE